MKVLVVSGSPGGRAIAESLPYEYIRGALEPSLSLHWDSADVMVCIADMSAVVRAAAPLLGEGLGPGLVCVDDAATWAVVVCEGRGSAAAIAVEVADRLDADAVLTDTGGGGRPDEFDAFAVVGDVDGLAMRLAEGEEVRLEIDPGLEDWPIPPRLAMSLTQPSRRRGSPKAERVRITDRSLAAPSPGPPPAPPPGGEPGDSTQAATTVLHPPSLVAGIGVPPGASARQIEDLVTGALAEAGVARACLGEVATSEPWASEVGVLALGLPVRSFTRERLLGAETAAKVAQSAARRAAGRDGTLITRVRTNDEGAAVVIARRARPRGCLSLVGLGPGDPEQRTGAAADAILAADVVVASGPDLEQVRDLLRPRHEVVERLPGDEHPRVRQALSDAERGRRVVLLCSGDAGIYALAPMACELAADADADLEVIPGVTAATSAAALLGAPLGHDFVLISLSDTQTPWEVIAGRIRAAGESDLVAVFYEPRTSGRPDQLARARRILLEHRKPETPVGIVTDAFRPEEELTISTLGDLDPTLVGTTTTVIVGSTTTTVVDGRMVTPAAYLP